MSQRMPRNAKSSESGIVVGDDASIGKENGEGGLRLEYRTANCTYEQPFIQSLLRETVMALRHAAQSQSTSADLCEVQCIDPRKVKSGRRSARSAERVRDVAETFKILGDPTRLRIVDALSRSELCVCDLALIVGASQSTVSHSLRALRQMRLVRYRRDGKIAYYSLDDDHIARLLELAFVHVEEQ